MTHHRQSMIEQLKETVEIKHSPALHLLHSHLKSDKVTDEQIQDLMLEMIIKQEERLGKMYKEYLGIDRAELYDLEEE